MGERLTHAKGQCVSAVIVSKVACCRVNDGVDERANKEKDWSSDGFPETCHKSVTKINKTMPKSLTRLASSGWP